MFALPLAIVVGREGAGEGGVAAGVVADPDRLAAILRDHGALSGNTTFALSNALVAAEAIDVARLPEILAWCRLPEALAAGALLAASRAAACADGISRRARGGAPALHARCRDRETWSRPHRGRRRRESGACRSRASSSRNLRRGERRCSRCRGRRAGLLPAVAEGRAAQRDVAAQIFASNAIRKFRGTVGEPTAVISAHRAPDAPGGGELRLSLSSPFDPKAAEGFRCPLFPLDRADDVVAMLAELLRDCRVTDIRTLPGVHADRADGASAPLMFKPETIADAAKFRVQ